MAALLLSALCAACESAPGAGNRPAEIKVLEVLDRNFVRFEGERMPLDEFLFRMRRRGQQAAEAGKTLFGIRLRAAREVLDPKLTERIIDDLRLSGIQRIVIG